MRALRKSRQKLGPEGLIDGFYFYRMDRDNMPCCLACGIYHYKNQPHYWNSFSPMTIAESRCAIMRNGDVVYGSPSDAIAEWKKILHSGEIENLIPQACKEVLEIEAGKTKLE